MSKQILVKVPHYKKEEIEVPFNLPEETIYLFKTGIRVSIRCIPVWTKWNKEQGKEEEIWKLNITLVYGGFDSRIGMYEVQISGIGEILRTEKGDLYYVLQLIGNPDTGIRTKEDFKKDFESVMRSINSYT